MTADRFFERAIGLLTVGLLIAACIKIIAPFTGALIWSTIIAVASWPVFERLTERLGGRAGIAAALITAVILLVIAMPVALLINSLADHVQGVLHMTEDVSALRLPGPPAWINRIPLAGPEIESRWLAAIENLETTLTKIRPWIGKAAAWTVSQGAHLTLSLLEFLLATILAGFLFVHGKSLAGLLERFASTIAGESGTELVRIAGLTIRSVTIGVMGTALIQSVLTAFGLLLAGVPGALLLWFASFLLATLQLGTGLVWIPAAVWLEIQDQTGWMIFMVVWGLFVNTMDNVIKPYLIAQGSGTPLAIVFLGVIGGMLAWGFIGIFIGSTLLAVSHALLKAWLDARHEAG
ncbi:AI-2E family transporter [Methylococcus geothermalis]|uniref:AI-2E family transporter n=1 Tax=Methylococcus geothermalis TaxID=2681310 RepID=A0A858Q6R4_9GAMM|nr:AI-2E family transporter [Methylococcus geothermalis]QJD29582.1 AI-2E family transporter [Methylococcus geothermalis]